MGATDKGGSIVQAAKVEARQDAEDHGRGQAETTQLGSGKSSDDLRRQAEANEHRRNERFRDHFERLAVAMLYAATLLVGALALTWIWHLLMPPAWHWLSAEQVTKVQSLLLGGIVTSVITGHIKKRLG